MTGGGEPGVERPQDTPDGKSYHDEIVFAAFGSLDETEATLASLGSFLVWHQHSGLDDGRPLRRWLLRKTMVPLTRLVESVQSLDAANPGWTLAEVGTRDELDDLRRAFNDLLARLHEAYDRQRRFSSEASHQLRTPVAVMIGHLEVAQRYERSGEQYRRVIHLAHKRSVELGQIVESLLFLSRPDTSTLTQFEPLDLNCWLMKYLENRPENDRSSDIVLRSSTQGSLWIKAQPHLLGQLVENLLDNACKYSRSGQPIVLVDGTRRRVRADCSRGFGLRDRAGGLDEDLRALLSLVVDFPPPTPWRRAFDVARFGAFPGNSYWRKWRDFRNG